MDGRVAAALLLAALLGAPGLGLVAGAARGRAAAAIGFMEIQETIPAGPAVDAASGGRGQLPRASLAPHRGLSQRLQ